MSYPVLAVGRYIIYYIYMMYFDLAGQIFFDESLWKIRKSSTCPHSKWEEFKLIDSQKARKNICSSRSQWSESISSTDILVTLTSSFRLYK